MNALKNGSRFSLFPVGSVAREMNQLLDNSLWGNEAESKSAWFAPASVWEDDSSLYFEFDLPGISIDAIDVKIADNHLHLTAERAYPENQQFALHERMYGKFERSFKLNSKIDENSVEANLVDGVLHVRMAKAPEAQVKTIAITSKAPKK